MIARSIPRALGGLLDAMAADRIKQALRGQRANLRFLKWYCHGLMPQAGANRFIVLGLMRSGSTIFGDLLGGHP